MAKDEEVPIALLTSALLLWRHGLKFRLRIKGVALVNTIETFGKGAAPALL